MRDLAGIRRYIWTYLDLDEEDLPADLIDTWVQDGYRQIIQAIRRWPHFEVEVTIQTEPGRRSYPLPPEIEDVLSVDAPWGVLDYIEYTAARDKFHLYGNVQSQGHARAYSIRGGELHVWPLPDASEELVVVGFRAPADWMAGGAGAVPDMPDSLEGALLDWVLYRAHLHQDEPELAAVDRQNFQDALDNAIAWEIKRPSAQPLVMGGDGQRRGSPTIGRPTFPWEF